MFGVFGAWEKLNYRAESEIASGTSVTLVGGKGRLETEIELLGKRKRDIHRERERDTVISC